MKKFDKFRFEGLNPRVKSNKYLTMERVSEDKDKIVVKVDGSHLISTRYEYALILDYKHVVFLKNWCVEQNYYGCEVLLNRQYWNVKEWGDFSLEFGDECNEQRYDFDYWLKVAISQNEVDEDGDKKNKVHWRG